MPIIKKDKSYCKVVGKRIRQTRLKFNLSQKLLALKCGWHHSGQTRLSQYELGKRELSSKSIIELSSALTVTPQWLMFGSNENNKSE